ncbi:MAG TPA: GTPase ObgE [Dehalococcoidales bacterium]|nr:GTPase ObgE [Dehalococcoidales bacterium]
MIDRVEILVKAGYGGDGAISFRREKFVPYGGPDGGDGGNGGNVVIKAESAITSLLKYRHRKQYRAGDGRQGAGNRKHGRNGSDLILQVPPGTLVTGKTTLPDNELTADLKEAGEQVVVASGGRGGKGNVHFASSTQQAPRIAQQGEPGEECAIILEMRLIADVGIIGYPNAGKSTLLAKASAARPKIASYPFTTLEPILGAVEVGMQNFILAEIPGLIEDAHLGRGLGHEFLRHSLRTKLLLHLIDGSREAPVADMIKINNELVLYDSALARKPQLVTVNKVDLPQVAARQQEVEESFRQAGIEVFFVSAATGQGINELMAAVAGKLRQVEKSQPALREAPGKIFRPQPRGRGTRVRKEGETFVIQAPELERIVAMRGVTASELRALFRHLLARAGIVRELEKAGVKSGDRVRCGTVEWEW